MVSTETWMGSGQSVTLAPESELFLGYMPYGPTLGRTGTNKAHLIKYSLGYGLDATNVTPTSTAKFSDYYELVPDLYTGCTAEFYYTDDSSAPTLRFSANVAGNDADAIYFSGQLNDFPSLFNNDTNATTANPRGYIILKSNGAVIPAPNSFELIDNSLTQLSTGDATITNVTGNAQKYVVGDIIRSSTGVELGRVVNSGTGSLGTSITEPTSSTTHLHLITNSLATVTSSTIASVKICTIVTSTDLTGILTAGDEVSNHASAATSSVVMGRVITVASDSIKVALDNANLQPTNADQIYLGKLLPSSGNTLDAIYRVSPRILSNNWIGLTNSVGIPQVEMETKQMNLSLAGSRNYSYQYRGIETAGAASLDVNLNHGTWLYYAFGKLASASSTVVDTDPATNHFQRAADGSDVNNVAIAHQVYAGYNTDPDRDYDSHSQNGKFHRVLKGTTTICPPLLPNTGIAKLTLPNEQPNGVSSNLITYTFGERNDNELPSFALELLVQKGNVLDGTNKTLMVDRNTYSESVYAQIYPNCVVSDMSLSANENEEVKVTLNLNTKRVFEAPAGYVGKCYDATNNDTSEFKNLLNFGQQTGNNSNIVQSFVDPFFFSNGSITLFGQEFMKVSTFSISLNNTLTDKRYVGNYNNQIKYYVPGQRTYEVTFQAMVTDRRIFDELRKQSPHRFNLGETADGSNAKIALSFTKPNGESISLEFDDYMISAASWPIQDDRGPVMVDFTIMPIRTGTINASSHWVLQS